MAIKKWLKDASENYSCPIENNIRPISTIDAEFISELYDVLDKRGGNKELLKILKRYKNDNDGHVLDELVQYSLSIDEETGEDGNDQGGKSTIVDWIELKDRVLQAFPLISLRKHNRWVEDDLKYTIIVNEGPMAQKTPFYENLMLDYDTQEERDDEYSKIKDKLSNYRNVRFL